MEWFLLKDRSQSRQLLIGICLLLYSSGGRVLFYGIGIWVSSSCLGTRSSRSFLVLGQCNDFLSSLWV